VNKYENKTRKSVYLGYLIKKIIENLLLKMKKSRGWDLNP
jgi:hypothetical protein